MKTDNKKAPAIRKSATEQIKTEDKHLRITMDGERYDRDFPNHKFPRPIKWVLYAKNEDEVTKLIDLAMMKYGCDISYFSVSSDETDITCAVEKCNHIATIRDYVERLYDAMVRRRPSSIIFDNAAKQFLNYVNTVILPPNLPNYICVLGCRTTTIDVYTEVHQECSQPQLYKHCSNPEPIMIQKSLYAQKCVHRNAKIVQIKNKETVKKTKSKKGK